jgi:hypothetical protein
MSQLPRPKIGEKYAISSKSFQRRIADMASKALPERPQASCVEPTTVALLDHIIARAYSRGRKSVKKMRLFQRRFADMASKALPEPSCVEPTTVALLDHIIA